MRETEYAEEEGRLYIPRLQPVPALNRLIEDGDEGGDRPQRRFLRPKKALELILATPGISDDSLYFTEVEPTPPPELGPTRRASGQCWHRTASTGGRLSMLTRTALPRRCGRWVEAQGSMSSTIRRRSTSTGAWGVSGTAEP